MPKHPSLVQEHLFGFAKPRSRGIASFQNMPKDRHSAENTALVIDNEAAAEQGFPRDLGAGKPEVGEAPRCLYW